MKVSPIVLLPLLCLLLSGCDGIRERMEAERAYQEEQKAKHEAVESRWQIKTDAFDLEVRYSDDDEQNQLDRKELALFTAEALKGIADFPHLNLLESGGERGTIRVHYSVQYADFRTEDHSLKWKIPNAIEMTIEAPESEGLASWGGAHRARAEASVVESVVETQARSYALDQYRKLINSCVTQLQAELGSFPVD